MNRKNLFITLFLASFLFHFTGALAAEPGNRAFSFIILDIDGDGVEVGDLKSKDAVYWDIDLDGFAEATAWCMPDDGILAVDLNKDGIINDNAELLGIKDISPFEMLAEKDSNHDGIIDRQDAIWSYLLLWQDLNSNGHSEKRELFSLSEKNIVSIDLDVSAASDDINGNLVFSKGVFNVGLADTAPLTRQSMASVFPAYNDTNTVYSKDYKLNYRVLFLPTLRGYGTLPDLHIAMSLDDDGETRLLKLVESISALTLDDLLNKPEEYENRINSIIYRWARADGISPDGRGPNVDARQLEALERLMGEKFVQTGAGRTKNPLFWAGHGLYGVYNKYYNHIFARISAQSIGKDLFRGNYYYNIAKDNFEGVAGLDLEKLESVGAIISKRPTLEEKTRAWKEVVRIIEYSIGVKALSLQDRSALENAIVTSLGDVTLEKILFSLDNVSLRSSKGHDYASRVLGLDATGGNISDVIAEARQKDSSKQIVFSDIATSLLQSCCKTKEEVFSYLKNNGFHIAKVPITPQVVGMMGKDIVYTDVIRGGKIKPWDRIKGMIFFPHDQTMLYVLLNGDKVEWSYAQLQRW